MSTSIVSPEKVMLAEGNIGKTSSILVFIYVGSTLLIYIVVDNGP